MSNIIPPEEQEAGSNTKLIFKASANRSLLSASLPADLKSYPAHLSMWLSTDSLKFLSLLYKPQEHS